MAFIKNKLAGIVLTVLSALVMLFGIFFGLYDSPNWLEAMGEILFSEAFLYGLYLLAMFILLFASIAGLVIGILVLVNVIKAEKVAVIFTYVLAIIAVVMFIAVLIFSLQISEFITGWATIVTALLAVAAIVVTALRKKIAK